jgi:hypothetical protein
MPHGCDCPQDACDGCPADHVWGNTLVPVRRTVHDGLTHGGETDRFPAAAAQEDKEKRVVVPADGGARGSGQRQQRQRAHGGSGAARAGGRADAAPATRSASAAEAQRWAFSTGDYVVSSPAVSPDGASLFVGSDDSKVYALNAATEAHMPWCAAGKYSARPSSGASACTDCAAGQYSAATGASSCSPYPAGSFASSSSSSCTPCSAGKYTASSGASACTAPAGGGSWGKP